MARIATLAFKDLRILVRVRSGLFFTFVWPIIVAILFGVVFAGQSRSAPPTLRVVLVDEDGSEGSRAFAATLEASGEFVLDRATRGEAEAMVRRGARSAYVVIAPGFAASATRLFYGAPRRLEIGHDPARQAEASLVEGLLTRHAMQDVQELFTTLDRFLRTPADGSAAGWQPIAITRTAVVREAAGPSSGFAITFPQGIVWGIIGCVMTFAIGLVSERVRGTFVRLQMAPLSRAEILGGKALACGLAILLVQGILLAIGIGGFGLRPASAGLLALACLSAAAGFVGFMMMVAGLGTTEQAVGGAGWALLMPMALFGGAMMPQFVMPGWMQTAGHASPIKWAILALEGALWRGFTLAEMILPCGILLGFGAVCFAIGVAGLRER